MAGSPFDTVLSSLSSNIGGLLPNSVSLVTALKAETVFFFVLAGPSMYFLMRKINGSRNAAFISGLVYLLLPFHVLQAGFYTHLDQTLLMAIVPIDVVALIQVLRRPSLARITVAALAVAIVFPLYAEQAFAVGGLLLYV